MGDQNLLSRAPAYFGRHVKPLVPVAFGASAINNLVAFYNIHGGKREVLFFYFVPDTTQDIYRASILIET
jgi:hypothetical protein